ncbi:helix-turn-helix domain-containing protein [Caldifermentibacillus hisashii]|uniref:helix-turn-helix domain-containing protein n=1 Tax=Caldifermentibacillus hisashii TaxID=996558 RepID=UPI0030E95AA5
MEKESKASALPFNTTMGFAAIPTAVCKYYVRHPKFTPATERLYRYLLQRHNSKQGYAWPSYSVIRRETGIGSDGTISKAIKALDHLGLVKTYKQENESGWDSNYYVFLPPIEDEEEFMRKFGAELRELKQNKGGEKKANDDDLITWL